ncbi:hypothetical protein DUNSADRAFT_994 [Dunaliella salina]|uniref:Encoded protein n=1 Tax=Dunaliella salina TaxID=3046 RepID=A0ABQ7FY59_DUNSA|nr:hypothetical protein DUNSADRAFT_994 [Dunaliella salina]|eukprot:KAF5827288.1 hypothetical protein DUNSADRAFT_994 [Dunaliella salina]
MFMSKTVAHEVMPTQVPRHSFTLWFYDAIERAEAVATAQVHGRGQASEAEQQEARDLIRDMLSRGGEIQATYEGVAALQNRVARTSRASMGIVASIVGAPSTQALLDSIQHMVPSELENLNYQLAFMGQGAEHAHAPSF